MKLTLLTAFLFVTITPSLLMANETKVSAKEIILKQRQSRFGSHLFISYVPTINNMFIQAAATSKNQLLIGAIKNCLKESKSKLKRDCLFDEVEALPSEGVMVSSAIAKNIITKMCEQVERPLKAQEICFNKSIKLLGENKLVIQQAGCKKAENLSSRLDCYKGILKN